MHFPMKSNKKHSVCGVTETNMCHLSNVLRLSECPWALSSLSLYKSLLLRPSAKCLKTYKWKNGLSCFCNVMETHFSFHRRSLLHRWSLAVWCKRPEKSDRKETASNDASCYDSLWGLCEVLNTFNVKPDNFFVLTLSLWCVTWLNSVIVVEKWHHSLLNWSPMSCVFTIIFSLPLGRGFHQKIISDALCTLCPNLSVYVALLSNRWRQYIYD